MYWLAVKIDVDGKPVDNIINVDTIVRFGPRPGGSYMKLLDGGTVELLDAYSQLVGVLTKLTELTE
jgi:hypothetical protein